MPSLSNMIEDLFSRVTEIGSTMVTNNANQTLKERCDELLTNKGEATSLARSRKILQIYKSLENDDKLAFFQMIYKYFGVDIDALKKALDTWSNTQNNDQARNIHFASEPRSQELIRRLNLAPGGTAALVSMREDLIKFIKHYPKLLSLDNDIRHLFSSWFNRGFLSLEVINWSTSANILEKIIAYEAVHEIQGWDDLRRRVAATDRRLYAFFHASLPGEPLIFVEVALTDTMPDAIGPILSGDRQSINLHKVTTAVFYSISNCQAGLRGISFGNFLIKQVVEELKREIPNLKRFVTMSPVPGLRKWVNNEAVLDKSTQKLVSELNEQCNAPSKEFKADTNVQLSRLTTNYLLDAKHKHGGPFDPVSRFHLGNGARLEQINLWADGSTKGIHDSWGIMVNYEYDLRSIERNHEDFQSKGTISASPTIKKLNKKT